jgi:hypothetical protein
MRSSAFNSLLHHRILQHLSVFIISLGVFFLQGPPFVFKLWDHLAEWGDSFINSWILAWNAHALMTPGISVWNAPIFYPVKNSLAFSEAMFGNLWLTMPIQYLTDNPTFAANMLLLASFVLSSYCVFLLVYNLTGHFGSSLAAGIIFSFTPYRWTHSGHLQLLPIFWSALALLFANRFMQSHRKLDFFGMLVAIWIQYYASIYLGTMLLTLMASIFIYHLLIEKRGCGRWQYFKNSNLRELLLIGLLASIIVLLPLGIPYMKTAKEWNFYRSPSENSAFSAEPLSLLLRPSGGFAHYNNLRQLLPGRIREGEGAVFIGFTPWLLCLGTFLMFFRKKGVFFDAEKLVLKRYAWAAICIAILMLGPYLIFLNHNTKIPLPYQLIYYLIPGAKAMRVPARFLQPFLLCLSILAAFSVLGFARLTKQWRLPMRLAVITFVLVLCIYDYSVSDMPGTLAEPKERIPSVYRYLSEKDVSAVLEIPVGAIGIAPFAFRYMHYQTFHWKPVLGGMSGFYPPDRSTLFDRLDGSPTTDTLLFIQSTKASIVIIHLDLLPAETQNAWERVELESFGFKRSGRMQDALVWERAEH